MLLMRRYPVVILAALGLAACRPSAEVTPPPFGDSSTLVISTSGAVCDSLLWPLRDGAVWEYQYTAPDGDQQPISLSSLIQADGVTLQLGDKVSSVNCIDGAIIGFPPGMLGSGHPSLSGMIGLNPRGAFLPAQDVISMSIPWDVELTASGTLLIGTASLPIVDGKIVISSNPLPVEPVTTVAGTWSALPVQQTVYYEITVQSPEGVQQQILINAMIQPYFVEGIGLIRADFMGGSVSSQSGEFSRVLEGGASLELITYTLP